MRPPANKWIDRWVRSYLDRYAGIWKCLAIETKDDQIRLLLKQGGNQTWTTWRFNDWKKESGHD